MLESIAVIFSSAAGIFAYWERRRRRQEEKKRRAAERREQRTALDLEAIRKGWSPEQLRAERTFRGLDDEEDRL